MRPREDRTTRLVLAGLCLAVLSLALSGCHKERLIRQPGETDILVSSVVIQGPDGRELHNPHGELFMLLGLRPGSLLILPRPYNDFRLAEDRRRLISWWQSYGYFDVEVDEPKTSFSADGKAVDVTWTVREGVPYRMASVDIRHAPEAERAALWKKIPFEVGDRVDLEKYRHSRHDMAFYLQRLGWGHANVYTRAYVDRAAKRVHWMYFVDVGPKTTIGRVSVEGSHRIPEDLILWRGGVKPGDPYSLDLKESIEQDLLDTGAFASVVVKPTNLAVERVLPGERPDSGGAITDAQIDSDGNLVPRELPGAVDFRLGVVEAPSRQLRMRAGAEADPSRGDLYAGSTLWLRNLFGPFHHLVLEGRVGYGVLWSGDEDESSGAYGEALVRTVHAGLLGRLVDGRLSGRYRDVLYPGFRMREVTAGPGVHAKLAQSVFLDVDALFRFEKDVGFGPFSPEVRDDHALPDDDTSKGGELDASLIWDARNDRVEPTRGHLFGLRGAAAPNEGLGTHRYYLVAPEARGFLPLSESASIGLRSSWAFVLGESDEGVPIGPRLFGGGAFGMRGFGRDRLSPEAPCSEDCDEELVGGLSLMESQLEVRVLPFRKTFGVVGFVDAGAAGRARNPFDDGISMAVGFGPRLRLWYVPISLDFAYRFLRESELESAKPFDPYLVFLRIGEAF